MLKKVLRAMDHSNRTPFSAIATLLLVVGCGGNGSGPSGQGGQSGSGVAGSGGSSAGSAGALNGAAGATAGAGGAANGGAATGGGSGASTAGSGGSSGSGGSGGAPVVGTCSPPDDTFNPIQNLSQTGCVDPTDPTKFAARAVPYEVNSPLWSDGADKTRAFVLPAGQKIHIDATTGKWVFPVGAVMIKNFMFDGKFVETRLFMHSDADTWVGYGYKWNGQGAAKQTEATVVGIGRDDVMFDTGKQTVHWYYPSRQDCMDCHNAVAGRTLGPSNAQMFRTVAGHAKSQLDEFQDMGLFDAAPVAPTPAQVLVAPYPGQVGTLDQRARSYLQANCAHCHQPNDGFTMSPFPNFDLRFGTALKDANICNVNTNKGLVPGSTATKILVPGSPMNSVMWVRMNEPPSEDDTTGRMPQIGTHIVDAAGLQLISDWITQMAPCP
jgi:uncharacterized repeat protein (TIGR03806 family)